MNTDNSNEVNDDYCISIDGMLSTIPKLDFSSNEFDVDFSGEYMIRIERVGSVFKIINAMNGWGNNFKEQFINSPVHVYKKITESNTSAEPIKDEELAWKIIKKNIPNGIANVHAKSKGNGKPQYQAEIDVIKLCMEQYSSQANNSIGNGWVSDKPDFKDECTFVTATKYDRNSEDLSYDYAIWQIKTLEGEYEKGQPASYLGLLNGEGEEWGPLEDLSADLYLIIPEIIPQ